MDLQAEDEALRAGAVRPRSLQRHKMNQFAVEALLSAVHDNREKKQLGFCLLVELQRQR